MKILNKQIESFNYFQLEGKLNTDSISKLQIEIDKAMKFGSRYFVFDFAKLEYINSSGLRIFIKLQKELKLFDGFLTIFAVNDKVASIINISELNTLLRVRKSLDEIILEMGK
jgi:anti-sigma B factor antagonist